MYLGDEISNSVSNFMVLFSPGTLFVFLTLLITFTILFFTEKRSRKLILKQSREVERINNLADIDDVEKKHLIDALNCLPEVIEEYPLPDVPLRLTAKISKFYALFKLTMLVLYVIFFSFMASQIISGVKFNQSHSYAEVIIIFCTVAIVILAIFELIMAKKLTYGSFKARRFLIFSWLFNPFLIFMVFSSQTKFITMPIIFILAIFCLWTLFLRNGAKKAISFAENKEFSKKIKIVFSFVVVVLTIVNLSFKFFNVTLTNSFQFTVNSAIGYSMKSHKKVNQVNLLAFSEDRRIKKIVQILAEKITKKNKIKVNIITDEKMSEFDNTTQQITVMINKVNVKNYKDSFIIPEENENLKKLGIFLNSEGLPKQIIYNPFVNKLRIEVDNNAISEFRLANFQKTGSNNNASFSLAYLGDEEKALKKMAGEIYQKVIVDILEKSQDGVTIPDYICNKAQSIDIIKKFNFLESAEIINQSYDFYNAQKTYMRIPVKSEKLVEQINKLGLQLVKNNFKRDSNGNYENSKTREAFTFVLPKVNSTSDRKGKLTAKDLNEYSKYIVLLYQRGQHYNNLESKKCPKEVKAKFTRFFSEYPETFIKLRYNRQHLFDSKIELNIYHKIIKEKELSCDILRKAYSQIQKIKCDQKLKDPIITLYKDKILSQLNNLVTKPITPKKYVKEMSSFISFFDYVKLDEKFKKNVEQIIFKHVPVIKFSDVKFINLPAPNQVSQSNIKQIKNQTGFIIKNRNVEEIIKKSQIFKYPYNSQKGCVIVIKKNGKEFLTLFSYELDTQGGLKIFTGSNSGSFLQDYKGERVGFSTKLKNDKDRNGIYCKLGSISTQQYRPDLRPLLESDQYKVFFDLNKAKKEVKVIIFYRPINPKKIEKLTSK